MWNRTWRLLALALPMAISACGGGSSSVDLPSDAPTALRSPLATSRLAASRKGAIPGDFDGDGRIDLIWSGELIDEGSNFAGIYIGLQAAADKPQRLALGGPLPSTGFPVRYHLQDTADFDGDGKADLVAEAQPISWAGPIPALWTDLMLLDGARLVQRVRLPLAEGERVIAAADFDGDGRPDLLTVSNEWGDEDPVYALLLMDGTRLRSRHVLIDNPARPSWRGRERILAVVDADGDGRADLITSRRTELSPYSSTSFNWDYARREPLSIWYMNGASPRQVVTVVPAGVLLAVGDFNGDGHADLLLRQDDQIDNGRNFIRLLRDGKVLEERLLATGRPYNQSGTSEQVLDIDGDGKDDLLFDGVSLWAMDGAWPRATWNLQENLWQPPHLYYSRATYIPQHKTPFALLRVDRTLSEPGCFTYIGLTWSQGRWVEAPYPLDTEWFGGAMPSDYSSIASPWRRGQQRATAR